MEENVKTVWKIVFNAPLEKHVKNVIMICSHLKITLLVLIVVKI